MLEGTRATRLRQPCASSVCASNFASNAVSVPKITQNSPSPTLPHNNSEVRKKNANSTAAVSGASDP